MKYRMMSGLIDEEMDLEDDDDVAEDLEVAEDNEMYGSDD
jgi:hypothetical protein